MIWETGIEIRIISSMEWVTRLGLMHGYWMLGASALGRPRGMVWGGRREEGSGWGTHVYLWRIHFDIWQNQYNIIKFKTKKATFSYPIQPEWGFIHASPEASIELYNLRATDSHCSYQSLFYLCWVIMSSFVHLLKIISKA